MRMKQTTPANLSRRKFIARTGAAMVLPLLVPGCVVGREARARPSNRINLGVVGWGMQGPGNTQNFLNLGDCQVVAACDLDKNALQQAVNTVNKGYGNTVSTPYLVTTTASDLLWSFCGSPGGTLINPGTAPIEWIKRISPNGTGMPVLVEDGVTTNAGAYYGQCTGPDALLEIVTLALKP